ncbi:MAG: hypothetical protein VZR02_08350 [Lachnospiraceae bacterium]|nr:hypothetical protein [Lachnospiraceae bacterium]
MSDVNHTLSRALVRQYGKDTLFVIEDLKGVSFDDRNHRYENSEQFLERFDVTHLSCPAGGEADDSVIRIRLFRSLRREKFLIVYASVHDLAAGRDA